MNRSVEQNLPSLRALVALEGVARLGNITRTADELHTSQAAISRHVRRLEEDLGVALIARDGRGIKLTAIGQSYARDITAALNLLREASERARVSRRELTIACTHEVSHLILMPRYATLKLAMGKNTHIRIVTCDYRAIPNAIEAGADIVFEYRKTPPMQLAAAIANEEVVPAVSPEMLAAEGQTLYKSPVNWGSVPRLELSKDNSGWVCWDDWFRSQAMVAPDAPRQMFDNYVYALEAAARGEGLVLAWRGFAERYFESGQLVPLSKTWMASGSTLYAIATPSGLVKQLTKKFIRALTESRV